MNFNSVKINSSENTLMSLFKNKKLSKNLNDAPS